MSPDLQFAVARSHQQELRRQAEAARLAAEVPTSSRRPPAQLALPKVKFGVRVAAIRARLAHV